MKKKILGFMILVFLVTSCSPIKQEALSKQDDKHILIGDAINYKHILLGDAIYHRDYYYQKVLLSNGELILMEGKKPLSKEEWLKKAEMCRIYIDKKPRPFGEKTK